MTHKMWYLQLPPKMRSSWKISGLVIVELGHYCKSSKGLFNVEEIKENIMFGSGKSMMATKIGRLKFRDIQLDGSALDITLHEVKFVPELWVDLFIIYKSLKNGYHLGNQGLSICLSKGSFSITFDSVM
jgi:hypothetical protein